MPFLTQGKTNWKFLLIIFILAVLVGGGILAYQYWWLPENKIPEKTTLIESELNLKTTKLATIPEGYSYINVTIFSPDGTRVAFIAEKDGKFIVSVNGKEGPLYDKMIIPGPVEKGIAFSPDSKTLAYAAQKGDKWFMIVNDKEGKAYDKVDIPIFSSDNRLAYAAQNANKWFMVVDGIEKRQQYDGIVAPTFSNDGKQLAYSARKGTEWFMVENDKEFGPYESYVFSVFSPDGKQLAFIATRNKKMFIVANGKEGSAYDYVFALTYSPDGKQLFYLGVKEDKIFEVLNGKEGKSYDFYGLEGEIFGMAYFSTYSYYYSSVISGDPMTWPPVSFSPDGKEIAYLIIESSKYIDPEGEVMEYDVPSISLVVGDKKYPDAWSYNFSPDWKKVVYISSLDHSQFTVINGEKAGADYRHIWYPLFSPDSNTLAYTASKDNLKFVAVVNGKEGRECDSIKTPKLKFVSNGKYITYGAQIGQELWWIVDEVR